MNRINILDDLTINKIAAGEVVERPSSVVKELVENCVDAGSTKVIIEIIDGGKKLIRITDNGCGIPSSEVDKSFLRHATSKIEKIDDLYDLYSLGFRGEALASISAICKLEMITKTKDECIGTKVIVEGGKVISKEPVGANNGTTIIIKDIFYNTPVRQKFLKSTHAETINISDLINKLAIGNPSIQFKYINNNKPMLNTPGDNKVISVIRSIYGKDVCENLIEVEYECKHFKINGYIGNNNVYRSNKNLQHVYINKRFVKSKVVLDAISEAYKAIIPINKHGVCFLNIEIDPASIDVNIHPTKLEIKFENEKELYIELRDFLRKSLLNSNLIGKYETYDNNVNQSKSTPSLNTLDKVDLAGSSYKADLSKQKNIDVVEIDTEKPIDTFLSVSDILNKSNNEDNLNYTKKSNLTDNEYKSIEIKDSKFKDIYEKDIDENFKKDTFIEENINESKEALLIKDVNLDLNQSFSMHDLVECDRAQRSQDLQKSLENNIQKEPIQEVFFKDNEDNKFSLSAYNVIGTIFDTYIILSKDNSMYLLDQHAAHERVLYEKYMDKFYKSEINMQMLLDPIVLEISNVDMLQVEKNLDLFMKFGFEIEIFGNNHIMIRCVPTVFGVPESEKFILQIIDNIDEIKNNYELKGEKFASMACRAAIKANDKIKNLEITSLFKQMEECINPFTCPHGRPVIVEISKNEIEKMFKRIM
ncbi:DNA mismatch repair endonuclease MutL [Romboutsia sp.]|uniref:DNA mismatch repair endonuclease MutL n=1 Tax=Romboutsia sp. TaxID=1965302 RepID=UPI002C5F257C|nr:DNA mismatch repair endonuclease MutL [Romboutsia sp.]HSQ90094.1 DNA mismatch repair endonuclease MutL [Romboutsia sp.]